MEVTSPVDTAASLLKNAFKLLTPLVVIGAVMLFFGAELYDSFVEGAYGDVALAGIVVLGGLLVGGVWLYKRLDAVLLSKR